VGHRNEGSNVVIRDSDGQAAGVDSSGNLCTKVSNTVDVNVLSGGGSASPVDAVAGVNGNPRTVTVTGTTPVDLVAAAAGLRTNVFKIWVSNGDSSPPNEVEFSFDGGTTWVYDTELPTIGSSRSIPLPSGGVRGTAVNTAIQARSDTASVSVKITTTYTQAA
jgi:hypothetical protein